MTSFRMALVQVRPTRNKEENIASATKLVLEAAANGADLVVLPELFTCVLEDECFIKNAEFITGPQPGTTTVALSQLAKDANIYLVGGSYPEKDPSSKKIYNTCTVWNNKGEMIAMHRKVHLYDVDIPNKLVAKESNVFAAGNSLTSFDSPWGKIGVAICYDVRYPEMAMYAARQGCVAMIYPAAFNTVTGPLHWELLLRSRALDNMIFVAGCGPANTPTDPTPAYGHSMIVGPKGNIIESTGMKESIIMSEINLAEIDEIRSSIPIYTQRRFDVYSDISSVQ
ncbi:hypothetical protein BB559_005884 [Furculomyces boomerangus]|uniref:CN hydrolase domain-containing protein n=2 Tax=Harpellales TaxID=61421 RepID=A0A2T9Y610_9FUNG|nr:hypothetical protein BB559_005884 [Furculomyces boomerangus]PVZ97160.1 hypothetical protein BB558_006893 [Smittium angustum]